MHELQSSILETAIDAARGAGEITLEFYQTDRFEVELKQGLAEGTSVVTVADRESERYMREFIRRRFPTHGIRGEEGHDEEGTDPVMWHLDPIDGTKTFIRGVPFYGVMVGVEIEGRFDVGVVHFPALGDMHYAARGMGSFWNGKRQQVSPVSDLGDASVMITDMRKILRDELHRPGWMRLCDQTALQRTWGDCYGHILVATGRAEVMIDTGLATWDFAALLPIIEEAGGRFTNWENRSLEHNGPGISTNRVLHEKTLAILKNQG